MSEISALILQLFFLVWVISVKSLLVFTRIVYFTSNVYSNQWMTIN